MIGPSFMDDIDCGDFFDNIDDLLDFPIEDVEGAVIGGDCDSFQSVWPPLPDTFMGSSSGFSGNSTTGNSELPTELPVPYEDIAQLEWLSTFVEESFSAGSIILDKENSSDNNNTFPKFQTSSPVSVLDSSSSCSGGKTIPGRARSKRSRPPTFNPRPVMSLISPTSSVTEATSVITTPELPNDLESFAESHPPKNIPKPISEEHKKKKKKKVSLPFESQVPITVRKCLHCEITKTPQWRAGPMGPKTLCNACGVRYKSGRLFPEYRPAASPTFAPAVHSNSHKKVLEMRNKVDQKTFTVMTAIATSTMPTQEFLPKSSHLLDSI